LKTALNIFTAVLLIALAGCQPRATEEQLLGKEKGKELLTVDFQEAQVLRYRFVSSRNSDLDWDPAKNGSQPGGNKVDKFTESMDMVVAYTPIEVDPYGLTTIKATCESVKVERNPRPGRQGASRDAAESLAGKSFTLTVDPTGKIEDYSQLEKLIHEVGKDAFRQGGRQGRVKEPDMIDDFICSQWFLWDSVASMENALEGVSVGQSWKSKILIPTSMVIREGRAITYRLDKIRQTNKGRVAVIRSSYSPAESASSDWPIPYTGSFQMSGTFGFLRTFLRGLKVLNLQGQGEELFNIDAGRIEQYNQQYEMQLGAASGSPLPGLNPRITIRQRLTMQILE